MRKWIRIALLLSAGLANGQVIHTTAALDADNVFIGANQFSQSVTMNESVCLAGGAGTVLLCDDPTSHRLKFNSNNLGYVFAVGISAAGSPGHCAQLAANGIDLADSGGTCGGGGGGGVAGSGTTNTLPLWTNGPGSVLGDSIIQQPNSVTLNIIGQALQFNQNSTNPNTISTGTGSGGTQGQQIIITTSCGTITCASASYRSASSTISGQNGPNASLIAGSSSSSGTGSGGVAQVSGGQALGSGTGGDVGIQAGISNTGIQGRVTMQPGNGGSWILKKSTVQENSLGFTIQMVPTGNTQTNYQVANGAPAFTCGPSTVYQRGDAPDVSHLLYFCPSGGTFTAVNPTGSGGAVTSVFGRTGAVVAASADYTAAQVTNAVSNSAANTALAAMTLNMASSTSTSAFRLPNIAVATTTTAGAIVYDTTNKNYHAGGNGVDNIVVVMPSSISPANNDCAKFTVNAGVITLNTNGGACGSGGNINGSGIATFIPVFTGTTAIGNSLAIDDGTTFTYTGSGGIAVGSTAAGIVSIGQGTAQPTGSNAISLTAPASVATGYNLVFPGAAGNGYLRWSNAANIVTGSFRTGVDLLGTNLDLTGQSASLGAQTLVSSTPSAGRYAINYYISESAGCATPGPGVVTATWTWTDATVARTQVSSTLAFTAAPGAGDKVFGTIPIWAANASAITGITTYTACTTGTATYDIHAWVTEAQ